MSRATPRCIEIEHFCSYRLSEPRRPAQDEFHPLKISGIGFFVRNLELVNTLVRIESQQSIPEDAFEVVHSCVSNKEQRAIADPFSQKAITESQLIMIY